MTTNAKKTQNRVSQSAVAQAAIHDIELLFKKMGLDPKTEKQGKRRLMGTAHVPTQLIVEMAATADVHGTGIGMAFDSAKARDALAYAEAFEAVATKAEAFVQRVRDAILVTKAETGAATLAAYATLKGVVRLPEGAPLRDSFDRMTQIMKRRRRAAPRVIAPPVLAAVQPAKAA